MWAIKAFLPLDIHVTTQLMKFVEGFDDLENYEMTWISLCRKDNHSVLVSLYV